MKMFFPEIINLLSKSEININNENELVDEVKLAVKGLISSKHRLHGLRVENMFGYVAHALGEAKLVKLEDIGIIYSDENLKVPDYRIILKNSERYLVEVKNCHKNNKPFKEQYVSKLKEYAKNESAELRIAIYWSLFGEWTLLSPDVFLYKNKTFSLSIGDALKNNEMSMLGDIKLAIEPSIRLELYVSTNDTEKLQNFMLEKFRLNFKIVDISIYVMNNKVSNKRDRQFIFDLIFFGINSSWEEKNYFEPTSNKNGKIIFEYLVREELRDKFQRFYTAGSLSRIFSQKFNTITTSDKIDRLNASYDKKISSCYSPIYPREDFPLLVLKQCIK